MNASSDHAGCRAFTLIELLVVVAITGMLAGLLSVGASRAMQAAHRVRCSNNLRQLHLANTLYADEHRFYVAAATDVFTSNRRRWHGVRDGGSQPFDGSRGPLAPYLGKGRRIRECPAFGQYAQNPSADNAFEASCGGYGYNDRGVGSQVYRHGYTVKGVANGMPPTAIRNPSATVMFTDAAFPQPYGAPEYLIEYSFAESYHFVMGNPPVEIPASPLPSIHFRHGGRANVVWCDGHVSAEPMSIPGPDGFPHFDVGWFGPPDNSLFDPE